MAIISNPVEELQRDILLNLQRDTHDNYISSTRKKLNDFKRKKLITHLDDFSLFFFEGKLANNLSSYSNKKLVDELLVTFFWNRIHRGGMWHSFGGDVYQPSLRTFSKIEHILNRVDRASIATPVVINHLYAGIHCAFQDWNAAKRRFGSDAYPADKIYGSFFRGSTTFHNPYTCIDFSSDTFEINEFIKTDFQGLSPAHKISSLPTFLFSCDAKYFNQFSELAVLSAIKSGIKCNFVFYIIENETIESLILEKLSTFVRLHGSEILFVRAKTELELRPISATLRFLAAYQIQKLISADIFVFDIDVEFKPEMKGGVTEIVENGSIGLCFGAYGRHLFPWSNIKAGASFFPNTEASAMMLHIYCLYIKKYFDVKGSNNWWIDQNALFVSYKLLRTIYPAIPLNNIHDFLSQAISNNMATSVREFKENIYREMNKK